MSVSRMSLADSRHFLGVTTPFGDVTSGRLELFECLACRSFFFDGRTRHRTIRK